MGKATKAENEAAKKFGLFDDDGGVATAEQPEPQAEPQPQQEETPQAKEQESKPEENEQRVQQEEQGQEKPEQEEKEQPEAQEEVEEPEGSKETEDTSEEGEDKESDPFDLTDIEFDSEQPDSITTQPDLSEIGQALGVESGEVDKIKEAINSLKSDYEKLQSQNEEVFADENLQIANELAREGKDYREYLQVTSYDWDKVDDREMGVWALKNQGMSQDEIEEMVESNPAQVKLVGNQAKQQQKAAQQQQKEKFESQAQKLAEQRKQRQKQVNERVSNEIKKRKEDSKIGDFKVPEVYWDRLNSKLTKGEDALNAYFRNKNGELDTGKLVETIARAEIFDEVKKRVAAQSKNEGKKETMRKLQNTEIPSKKVKGNETPKQEDDLTAIKRTIQKNSGNWWDKKTG